MVDNAQRVLLGRITTAHGIRGDVVIDSYTAQPADIAAYGSLQSADGAREFRVKVVRVTPKGVIAHVAGIDDRNGAEALRGTDLYASRSKLPAAQEGEYYYADLVGLRAEDATGEVIGTVVAVQNFGAGDLIEVRLSGGSTTEYVPFTDAFVPAVDIAAGRLVVILPASTPDDDEDDPEQAQ
ncbi:MAG: ribosome maturation factor RimM [Hyphomicrobium sp.]